MEAQVPAQVCWANRKKAQRAQAVGRGKGGVGSQVFLGKKKSHGVFRLNGIIRCWGEDRLKRRAYQQGTEIKSVLQ